MQPAGDIAVVIPARNESDRIAATVTAAAGLPGVDIVVVVDDGSDDGTAAAAERAGAAVMRHSRNRGKAAAMETGAEAIRLLEAGETNGASGAHQAGTVGQASAVGQAGTVGQAGSANGGWARPRHLLFLDADLAETAAEAAPLAEPVRSGQADMTIAVFSNQVRRGGHGLVVGLSGSGIERATGWRPAQPLNGQRCLTRAAFEAARPLAAGWGAETGLTIDLFRKGLRITEVEVPLAHRATGTDWRSQLHRARQLADVARALAVRQPGSRSAPPTRG
jgi:Glycosyl transferase family 2